MVAGRLLLSLDSDREVAERRSEVHACTIQLYMRRTLVIVFEHLDMQATAGGHEHLIDTAPTASAGWVDVSGATVNATGASPPALGWL